MASSFVKRPHGKETEDDLLRQQEEFLKSKFPPPAQAVRVTRPGDKRKSKSAGDSSSSDTVILGTCFSRQNYICRHMFNCLDNYLCR